MTSLPTSQDLADLIATLRPSSVLVQLGSGEIAPDLCVYRAEALLALDRLDEAAACLRPVIDTLNGDIGAQSLLLWSEILLRTGQVDAAILAATRAGGLAADECLRAEATAWMAIGYASKRCWSLAERGIRDALVLAPNHIPVRIAQGRICLAMDQRFEARTIYERLARFGSIAACGRADWGLASVAFLLGAFDEAIARAEAALALSDEAIGPLFVLGQLAIAIADRQRLAYVVAELERRSPLAESLPFWHEAAVALDRQLERIGNGRVQLAAFPTIAQRRDHCGPCTVELVLRYWGGGLDLTNDQIAQTVKFPGSGTPIYRMREFFHLVGFDTIRTRASVDQLRRLVDAGYPVIVEQEFPNTSHVTVLIGYDDIEAALVFQDPMTHAMQTVPVAEVERLRRTFLDSAIVAFPAGQGHDAALARLDLFDDPAVVWVDQAALALDEGQPQVAADLAARAAQRLPAYPMAWMLWLQALFEQWRQTRPKAVHHPATSLAARLKRPTADDASTAEAFRAVLAQTQAQHPDARFVHVFAGRMAMLEGDLTSAQAAFERANALEPTDARTLALLAECRFARRNDADALQAARAAIAHDPALASANIWMARCLAQQSHHEATHYAGCAAALAPNWWLAHLALAEAHTAQSDYAAARRALEAAATLAPSQPEVRIQRGILLSIAGNMGDAVSELEAVLSASLPLALATAYRTRQALCRICFEAELFEEAVAQVQALLALTPDDGWGLQFLSAARARVLLQAGISSPEATDEVVRLYEHAIAANQGAAHVVTAATRYLAHLGDSDAALALVERVAQAYPDSGHIVYRRGRCLSYVGRAEDAAHAMLDALGRADGIADDTALYKAISTIVHGLGAQPGEQAVLAAPVPEGSAPVALRERALGLALARYPAAAPRARELLQAALAAEPEDVRATLQLGEVIEDDDERERLFRRALMLAPRWPAARARLARELLRRGQIHEALEFTSGHEHETSDLLDMHGRALLFTAHYQEAAAVFAEIIAQPAAAEPYHCSYKWHAENDGGQHEAALATARAAVERFPEIPRWHMKIALSLARLGRLDESQQAIVAGESAGMADEEVLEAQFELAWAREDWHSALTVVDQLLAAAPEVKDHQLGEWTRRRLRLLLELGQPDEAWALVNSLALDVAGWGRAAWCAMAADAWDLCIACADRALALEPQDFQGLFTRAEAFSGLDREAEAVAAYHALRQIHPNEHNAYEKLGLLLALAGQFDEALALAERAVALGSFCTFAWATRGYIHFLMGNTASALADLDIGWNRADVDRRRGESIFWWVLAALQHDEPTAETRRAQSLVEAKTGVKRRHFAQVDTVLQARAAAVMGDALVADVSP